MKTTITISLLLICQLLISQENNNTTPKNYKKCNTTFLMNKELAENPEYQLSRLKIIESYQPSDDVATNKEVITIPIVVHVVYKNTHANIGSGTNISNERIEDAIRILNEDYTKTNPEFPILLEIPLLIMLETLRYNFVLLVLTQMETQQQELLEPLVQK